MRLVSQRFKPTRTELEILFPLSLQLPPRLSYQPLGLETLTVHPSPLYPPSCTPFVPLLHLDRGPASHLPSTSSFLIDSPTLEDAILVHTAQPSGARHRLVINDHGKQPIEFVGFFSLDHTFTVPCSDDKRPPAARSSCRERHHLPSVAHLRFQYSRVQSSDSTQAHPRP